MPLNAGKKVVCLMGPTASGKTSAAIELAQTGLYEIISVDSAMIYRGMDIGTAKPTLPEQAKAPHRLIDIRDPGESYSVGDFCREANNEIDAIFQLGKTPLLVGGTMMYFYQLQKGMDEIPPTDTEVRLEMAAQGAAKGWVFMHTWLSAVDPVTALRLKPNDKQRISRALEIYVQTGRPLSAWHAAQEKKSPIYEFSNTILAPQDRAIIHDRIEKRFDLMLAQGFLEEVETLYKRGDLNPSMPSIRCVGYRQAWDYFAGLCDKKTMREKAIIATRQLCKRQLTWLRRWENGVLR